MSKIISYSNNSSEKFCQIKLDDGNRIFISLTQTEIKVFKTKFFGSMPSDTVFEISTLDLYSSRFKTARERLTERSHALDILDVLKEILIECHSLEEVKSTLKTVFQENKSDNLNWSDFLATIKDDKQKKGLEKAILYFLQNDKIDVKTFISNSLILHHKSIKKYKENIREGQTDISHLATQSIEIVANPIQKGGYENWFLAAYPDVVLWFAKLNDEKRKEILKQKLDVSIKDDNLKNLRKIVNSYKSDHSLECKL